jgi:uncharacterized protein YigA (DUF484 family)
MANAKLETQFEQLVKIAQVQQQTISELKDQISTLVAEKSLTTGKSTVQVTGTTDLEVLKRLKYVYSRRKYNPLIKEKGCYKIALVHVDSVETTNGGHKKANITKTLFDGSTKSHAFMVWQKK